LDGNGIQGFLIKPLLNFYRNASTIVCCHLQVTNHSSKLYKDLTATFASLFAFSKVDLTSIKNLPNVCNIRFWKTISTWMFSLFLALAFSKSIAKVLKLC
jgi:hypothetical protein